MNTPKISILIANHNNGHFFKDAFKSLIAQTEQNWEAIIIEDCSTDDSLKLIKEIVKKDPRFKIYENKNNLGYQKNIIMGIELSSAPIFARLDPDDGLSPNAIELSLNMHKKHPQVGLVYSDFYFCNDQLEPYKVHHTKQINTLNEDYFGFNGEISHFASFKKEAYQKTSGIDPNNKRAEDKDIYMKMCEISPVKHIDKPLYWYRVHGGGVSTNSNIQKANFWHWVALIKMAERRNINIEDIFVEKMIPREIYNKEVEKNTYIKNQLKKSRWIKIGLQLGLFKGYKFLQ